jgi:hypothetical protein
MLRYVPPVQLSVGSTSWTSGSVGECTTISLPYRDAGIEVATTPYSHSWITACIA